MAFNIMDLFGPAALNRLIQPAPNTQGIQNMLMSRPDPQPTPVVAGVDPWQGMREEDVIRVDPMQTASAAQPVQQAQSAPAGLGGLLSDDRKAMLNDIFTGWAMGSTPSDSLGKGAQLVAANRGTRKNVNQTVQWLQSKGMDEQQAKMLAASPPALNEYLKTLAEGNDPMRALQMQKAQLEIQNLQDPNSRLSESERRYKQAVEEGFKGSRMDYDVKMKEAGRNQVNIDTGAKLPSGFRWKDPANQELGVEPIPGGPGEQIPGELAARVGMSESFAGQAPALRERLHSGEMTGPIDSLMGQFGMGARGETYRQLQSGTDALMRLLTGAGMNETEARAYAERYLPTMKDDPDSAVGKLDQLMRELEAAKGMAMRGRGGSQPQAQPGGVVDYQEYFKGP